MINYKQGDIVLVYFPESNLLTVKKRPAIVLQADDLKTGLEQIIIGMVTSNLERKGYPCRIFVDISGDTGKQTGLLSNSVIMTDNVVTVRSSEIYQKIGIFIEENRLKDALKYTFGV
ncbi:MAG: type II toxin-antitoxin system PemK/MazF family toxin [bacterium]